MKGKTLVVLRGALALVLGASGCRPGAVGPAGLAGGPPSGPSGPPDLAASLGATWTATVHPVGEQSSGGHADFALQVTAELRNTSSSTLEAGRFGYVVLEAPNLSIAPVGLDDLGGFALRAGGAKTLKHEGTFKARVQGRRLFLPDLAVRVACTAPISVAGSRTGRVVVVGRFPRSRGEAEGTTEIWRYSEGFLQLKAAGRDEWAAKLAKKLLEDRSAERG